MSLKNQTNRTFLSDLNSFDLSFEMQKPWPWLLRFPGQKQRLKAPSAPGLRCDVTLRPTLQLQTHSLEPVKAVL